MIIPISEVENQLENVNMQLTNESLVEYKTAARCRTIVVEVQQ
jgi:hypothetical protein